MKIILGDLNIHLNDEQSYDTELLNDIINSLGYKQHVSFYTHTAGHILDAVITKFDSDLILKCVPGKFIYDHCAVICYLKCHKERPKKQVQLVRRWNKELDQLYNDLSKIGLPNEESTSIDTLGDHFEDKLKLCLDKHAPLEQKEYVSRRNFPWYNEEIRTQKQKVRRRERIWKRYKTPDTLKALKVDRNKYKYMLKISKASVLRKKIDECGRDSKKLYKLITELTGGPK